MKEIKKVTPKGDAIVVVSGAHALEKNDRVIIHGIRKPL